MADPQIPRRPPLPDEPTVEQQLLRSTGSIVGIGASAGGLEAFTTFFRHMPPDSGLAFVLVQHLDPHQPSLLPDLLASQTLMPVHTIIDQMAVKPDQIYVIPPNTTLTIEQGVLGLALPIEARGHRMPIDHFFQSLAADQGAHAIGIVFSGADTDGTLGLAAIQDAGGLTLAQEPESARFATMPRSAIDRQVVDQVLPIVEMPAYLSAYAAESATNGRFTSTAAPQMETGAGLQAICTILRSTTGHDFSQYKPATLLRRIERRMQVTRATNLTTYAEQLRHDRSEANLLFQDLLISVTSFFRDPVAFDSLANAVVPALFHGKSTDSPLRVWVAGCATGEEAYTIAILLLEHMDRTGTRIPVQLFASDIDEAALVVARQGRYDAAIAAHISAERLTQFFSQEGGAYQVSKALRELCIFSAHNLISDPPFARMDLIVCRNLLIYFTADLQRQLVPLLHYALRPGGYLLLGSAESVAAYPELFRVVNLPQRIFQRNELLVHTMLPFPLSVPGRRPGRLQELTKPVPQTKTPNLGAVLEHLMVKEYAPPAVVVDAQGAIVYFFGHTGAYLEPPAGAASLNIHAMIRPELQLTLQGALRAAWRDQTIVRSNVTISAAGGPQRLVLIVRPLAELAPAAGLMLVVFQEIGAAGAHDLAEMVNYQADTDTAKQLADELQATRQALETTITELQEANAEQTMANEELLAINEELQSANEELQTSKEEIQSINEELQTVNAELQRKIAELDRVNGDLVNLFASTQIPAIFLHTDGRIARFTPAATEVFHLLATDVGRPITDITARFHDGDLLALANQVLQTLTPYEEAVHRLEPETWWIMHIRPYRTLANLIDGVVITFTNITRLKQAEIDRERLLKEMQTARIYAEQIVATVVEPLLILDADLRVQQANQAYYQWLRTTPSETEQTHLYDLGGGIWDHPQLRAQFDAMRGKQGVIVNLEVTQQSPTLGIRTLRLQARPIEGLPGSPLILLAVADITELTNATTVLQEAHAVLEQRVKERTSELAALNAALQTEVAEHRRSEEVRQLLLQQLITAQEEERRRVARELHDQLGQDLAGLILGLKALQDVVVADTLATERIRQLQALAMQIGQEVRTLAVQLRPAVLDDLGLAVALANYVEQWSNRAQVAVDLHMTGLDGPRLPLAVESTLYRLVQEALTNVLKHASAQGVSLILDRNTDEVRLIVEDDGVGFDIALIRARAPAEQRLGLVGMDERVAQLGGTLTIESTPGSGTTIFVSIPLATHSQGGTDVTTTHLSR